MRTLEVPGASLHYELCAPPNTPDVAPLMALLHGWGCDSSDWQDLIWPLATGRRVVALDLRGFGRSVAHAGDFSLPAVAGDVERLLEHLGARRAALVGHSAGAEVAALLAVRRPDLVGALVAVDPAYGLPASAWDRVSAVARRLDEEPAGQVAAEVFDTLDDPNTPPCLVDRHRRAVGRADPAALRGMYTQFAFGPQAIHFRPRLDEFLALRQVPLLGVYRDAGRAARGRELLQFPHDRVSVYDGCGHWPHQERPAQFVAELDSWLREAAA